MLKQMKPFIESFLSKWLCGYRKGFNAQFVNSHVCNFADDTTLTACGINMKDLLNELEDDTLSAIIWFENNYMQLNQGKCHFLT